MLNLLGEYNCKIDAKGRLMFPARLRKQMSSVLQHGLVVNRDIFEGCLVIYPQPEWDKVNREMSSLSRYNKKTPTVSTKIHEGSHPC
jgi:MraZ protein